MERGERERGEGVEEREKGIEEREKLRKVVQRKKNRRKSCWIAFNPSSESFGGSNGESRGC